jgi:ADP-ribosylglycohydrolase
MGPKDHPQLDLLGGPAPIDDDGGDDGEDEVDHALAAAADEVAEERAEDEAVGAAEEEGLPALEKAEPGPEPRFALDQLSSLRPHPSMWVGAILGGAIGDAMGHPTEFLSMNAIHSKYGPDGVKKFELYWDRGGQRFAPYTDDTQMAEAVLRALLESRHDGLDATMKRMAKRFIEWADQPQGGHRAPGNACMAGCRALKSGAHWSTAGGPQAGGCGSVMRAYPFGLVFANDLLRAERWAVAHSKLTHRDPIALAACAAMAVGMALVVRGESVNDITSAMVASACRYSAKTAAMMAEAIDDARSGVGPEETLDRLRAWAAHEAIAAAVYIFERHPDDARAAILEGANTPGDSDSIATLAGSLVGARVGAAGLPSEWVRDVERGAELASLGLQIGGERPLERGNP